MAGTANPVNIRDQPLTTFGRRVLTRHALLTPDGRVGAVDLARQLGVVENTVWKLLKTDFEDEWYMRPEWMDLSARLCLLLKVDHSWLFGTIEYGDVGSLRFELMKRDVWR